MEEKFYTRTNGEKIPMSQVNTEHLLNALSKTHREIYETNTKEQFDYYINKIIDIDEELTKRLKKYSNDKFKGEQ